MDDLAVSAYFMMVNVYAEYLKAQELEDDAAENDDGVSSDWQEEYEESVA